VKDEVGERLNRVVPVCVAGAIRVWWTSGHHDTSLQVHSNFEVFFLAMLFSDALLCFSHTYTHTYTFFSP